MVKFYVFGKGLLEDVRERYDRYLFNSMTMQHDSEKIQTIIVCSLLDIANLPITDKLLEKMGMLILLMPLSMQCYTNTLMGYGKRYIQSGIWNYYHFCTMRKIKVYS